MAAVTEADVRRDRAALIQRVQADDAAQRFLSLSDMEGPRVDGERIHWTDAELSSLFRALHTNTHVTQLMLNGERMPLSDEMMQEFTSMLAANRSITHIDLSILWRCALDGSTLAQGLKQHPMLGRLKLYEIKFSGGGIQAVLAALLECPTLQSLQLDWCREHVPPAITELCTLLRRARSLRNLSLTSCSLHGAPLRLLADALSTNERLDSLNISSTAFDDPDARCFAAMLSKNCSLTKLNLSSNPNIGEAGWGALVGALRVNRALVHLNLKSCALRGAPLRQLAEALSTNEKLRSLNLSFNQLDDDDARCLADMLRKDCTLAKLDLSHNTDIDEAGWRGLTDALRENHALTELSTTNCNISKKERMVMDTCLRRNKQHRAAPSVLSVPAAGSAPAVEQASSLPSAPAGCAALANELANVQPAFLSPASAAATAAVSSVSSVGGGQSDNDAPRVRVTEPQPVSPIPSPPRRPSGAASVSELCVPTSAELAVTRSSQRLSGEESVCEPCVPTAEELQSMAGAAVACRVDGWQSDSAVNKAAGRMDPESPRPLSAEEVRSVLSAPAPSVSPSASSTAAAAAAAAAPAVVAPPSAIPSPPTAAAEEAALLQFEALLLGQLGKVQQQLRDIRAAQA
jgi:Ran GTPase-activating protein (RanGAP) involved in mRNA processing and transport